MGGPAARSTRARKSAVQKRNDARPPEVQVISESHHPNFPVGRMVIASPLAVDAAVRQVRKGRVLTMGELRRHLATQFGGDYTCPLTTGIFLRVAAEAAEEEVAAGRSRTTPWWRIVRDDGRMLDKLPGGPDGQARRLRREGRP